MTPSGFLLINKPAGWTSFDVVAKLRGITCVKTIGHAGTLDPFATGLLIVAVGREATRQLDRFAKLDKTYRATFTLGSTSTTQDPEGEITATVKDAVASPSLPKGRGRNDDMNILPSQKTIERVIGEHFIGTINQVPPMHSAIKIGGKKLYELARQGKEVDRPARQVTINRFDIVAYNPPHLETEIDVSSGTYIRAIARDLGESAAALLLGTAANTNRRAFYRSCHHFRHPALIGPLLLEF